MAKGKWIEGLTPEQPFSLAARLALAERLDAVWYFLPLAALHADLDIEHVHQLRVATRRSRAALRLFADVIPPDASNWVRKQLRKLRQAAGDARDLDVFRLRLVKTDGLLPPELTVVLLDSLAAQRAAAQPPILDRYHRLLDKEFPTRVAALIDAIAWTGDAPEPTFAESARALLRPVLADFAAASQDQSSPETLHQLRIRGKLLRYAMELCHAAFPAEFRRELYPSVERLQDLLGEVNDHVAAIARLQNWPGEHPDPQPLIDYERAELEKSRQAFHDWWSDERAQDLIARLEEMLADESPESVE